MNTETKKETKKTKTKKSRKGLGIVLTLIGLIWGGLTLKGLFVNGPETDKIMADAVYVGTGKIDPANDGKPVIVCGKLKVTKPAYGEKLKIALDVPRMGRSAQKLELKEWNRPATEENREWKSSVGDTAYFIGKADVGNYHLSDDFLENIILYEKYKFDKKDLEKVGLTLVREWKNRGDTYIGVERMGDDYYKKGDRRYNYTVPKVKDGEMVTVFGIQDKDTIKYAQGVLDNLQKGELDRDTVIKGEESRGREASVFAIVVSFLLLVPGIWMIVKSKK